MNPIAHMASLHLRTGPLFQRGRLSYSETSASASASPVSFTAGGICIHLGHRQFTVHGIPFSSGPRYACPQLLKINPRQRFNSTVVRAMKRSEDADVGSNERGKQADKGRPVQEEGEEEEVEMSWIQEKAEDLVEFTGTVTQAIPGPRVGQSKLPWILAVPLAYMGLSLVIAIIKTIRKHNSPKEKRRKQVNKNAMLCKTLDDLFQSKRHELNYEDLQRLTRKTGFSMEEILRKYIRYALNEKPFNPDLVSGLIHLRKASNLEDGKVCEVLSEVSRRIVKDKGPVVMNTTGFTEKGIKRKAAVQALFSKLLYLSELDEFCSTTQCSLSIKEIFGVTDEDASSIQIETLSEPSDVDTLEKMLNFSSDSDSEEADSGNK